MKITADLFQAYLKCSTKCFLLAHGETGTGNPYAEWVKAHNEAYRAQTLQNITADFKPDECVTGLSGIEDLKKAQWTRAIDVVVKLKDLESTVHLIEHIPSAGPGKPTQYVPVRFFFTNKLSRQDKLLLAFDAYALSEMLGKEVKHGRIIHGDQQESMKVNTAALMKEIKHGIEKTAALLSNGTAPDLILNRHCPECEFQVRCKQKAIEKDDLSLLGGMTEKERKKYHRKGIFTVTQLSYTFRPRRPRKRLAERKEKHHPAAKALAIREKKILIIGSPQLNFCGTPVYLDVEGIPERDFYYLIGARIATKDSVWHYSFWANAVAEEKTIWKEFLDLLSAVPDPVMKPGSISVESCNTYGC